MSSEQGKSQSVIGLALYCTVAVFAVLTACTEVGPEQSLNLYNERLARTLQVEAPRSVARTIPKSPKISELKHALPSSSLGTLDFLSLSGCAVQITIGKRNSSLGIMASDSQRLLLELEFLEHAPECIRHMRKLKRTGIATILEDAFKLKRQQLPKLIYNATLANTEFRQFWKTPESLDTYPAHTSSVVLSALASINQHAQRWLNADYAADNLEFEILLSEVAKGDGGTLLKALNAQESHLATANTLLRNKLADGPLCAQHRRDAAADILPTVVQKFFIGEVQPWSADLGRRYHELLPAITQLEELLGAGLSEEYEHWRRERNQAFSLAVRAPSSHVALLKETMDSCGGFGNLIPVS